MNPDKKRWSSWRVRTQLIVAFATLVSLVVLVTAAYFIRRQTQEMRAEIESRRAAMRGELEKRGTAIARNVALSSERALGTLDFLFLTEILQTTLKNDSAFVYGVIMDNAGRAQVHTDPELAGKTLEGSEDKLAAAQTTATAFERDYQGARIIEVVAPVTVSDERWGVIRFGISMAQLDAQMRRADAAIQEKFNSSVANVLGVAALLLVLGSLTGLWAARRLSQPLQVLVASANRIRDGVFTSNARVGGALEFSELGAAFDEMARSIAQRDGALRDNNARLKEALERAQEAVRLKSEFLSNISHELRTPLNAIVNIPLALLKQYEHVPVWRCTGCGAMFERGADTTGDAPACPTCNAATAEGTQTVCTGDLSEHKHFLQRMRQSSQHLLGVVNDLLDFSKLEAGKMRLNLDDVDMHTLFEDAIDQVASIAAEKNIDLHFTPLTEAVALHADKQKLMQVLINLLGNALKFTPERGSVAVSCNTEHDGSVKIQVRDSGIGIPKDHLEAIFESFRQVDGSHTREKRGTGLGLSITRQLVQLHGGRVWAESEPGKGSVFTILLPRHAQATEQPTKAATHASLEHGSVMVIDDSAAQLELTKLVLEQDGLSTTLVDSSREAVGQVKERKPRAIILDIMMPEMDGFAILKELKSAIETQNIPVFVTTAFHAHRERVEQLGGIWLPKPWDATRLLQVIRNTPNRVNVASLVAQAVPDQEKRS